MLYIVPEGVIEIGDGAFLGSKLEKVVLPSSIKKIGKEAYHCCKKLKDIVLPSSLLSIGESAFSYCCSLEEISLPPKMEELGDNAYLACSSLKEFRIPHGIKEIPDDCLAGCKALSDVFIPNTVTKIGAYAFFEAGIKNIDLPSSIVLIGDSAFSLSKNLNNVMLRQYEVTSHRKIADS